jgi:hypothetical protein
MDASNLGITTSNDEIILQDEILFPQQEYHCNILLTVLDDMLLKNVEDGYHDDMTSRSYSFAYPYLATSTDVDLLVADKLFLVTSNMRQK